jgi:23S rRNA (guanosine2251-2'-O)-methyltransferase
LTEPKSRQRIVHGINAVAAVLRRGSDRIETVYLQDGLGAKRMARLTERLNESNVEITRCDEARLDQLVGTSKHQGVAAVICSTPPMNEAAALDYLQSIDSPMLLVLDSIQDPRNFGACLRTADAAGVDLVVTCRNRNVGFTPAVSKVASGAAETQPVAQVGNLARFLDLLKAHGIWVIGTDENAPTTVFDTDLNRSVALVLGSEGKGLRRLTRERCDLLVSLPMQGAVESLNVSVAAGICLYECLRQRESAG